MQEKRHVSMDNVGHGHADGVVHGRRHGQQEDKTDALKDKLAISTPAFVKGASLNATCVVCTVEGRANPSKTQRSKRSVSS